MSWIKRGAAAAAAVWGVYRFRHTRIGTRLFRPDSRRRKRMQEVPRTGAENWDIGTGVAGYVWRAEKPRAALLLTHGWGDYAERYVYQNNRLIPKLVERGISVYAFDLWGCGRSPGAGGAVSVRDSVKDHLAARTKLETEGLPLFFYGHSLGGLITAASLLRRPSRAAGAILASPALLYRVGWKKRLAARVLGWLIPTFYLPQNQTPEDVSRSLTAVPEERRKLEADPLLHDRGLSWVTASDGANVTHESWKKYEQIQTPMLLLHGTADSATTPSGSRKLLEQLGTSDKTIHLVSGGRHSLLDDKDRENTTERMLEWLETRIPAAEKACYSAEAAGHDA
ncbi:alpha/beta hydrolase [Alkalicoccus urumqiensis]|nr:alpha/beta hydrolase [Alkalicoccus urumqiensis]